MDKDKLKRIIHYEGSFVQKLYDSFWEKKSAIEHEKWLKQKNAILRNNGHQLLEAFFAAVNESSKMAWIDYGTLLGAYREKSFISHDFDVDCSMYAKDYDLDFEHELLNMGFKKQRVLYTKNLITNEKLLTEITFDYYGFLFDLFLYYIEEERMFGYGYRESLRDGNNHQKTRVIKAYLPRVVNVENLSIDGHAYPAPINAKETLETEYGLTFMTPIKDYHMSDTDPHFRMLSEDEYKGIQMGKWHK